MIADFANDHARGYVKISPPADGTENSNADAESNAETGSNFSGSDDENSDTGTDDGRAWLDQTLQNCMPA